MAALAEGEPTSKSTHRLTMTSFNIGDDLATNERSWCGFQGGAWKASVHVGSGKRRWWSRLQSASGTVSSGACAASGPRCDRAGLELTLRLFARSRGHHEHCQALAYRFIHGDRLAGRTVKVSSIPVFLRRPTSVPPFRSAPHERVFRALGNCQPDQPVVIPRLHGLDLFFF